MLLEQIVVFATLILQAIALEITPRYSTPQTSVLQQSYSDIKKEIITVPEFDAVTPKMLLKYGVVRVSSSNSIIASQLLAEEAFNPNYSPSDKRKTIFYEVSYSDAQVTRKVSDWIPIGGCHPNTLSETSSSFSQGYTVTAGSGITASVKFSQLLGISPQFSYDLAYTVSTGGSLTCSVEAGKTLQFQVMVETVTISNLKQRQIKISGDYQFANGYLARMSVGDWESVETFSQVNKGNVQTACVTDPQYLMC
ncbi:hypothetical protein HYPBUDRAFT_238557 [Hyphopichia burtonii NRRL Y-1933]|uniref:Flo11 domain-containing protein n=1 Tax=Hyphopichia burtonii NRRL Y-1933 TaxID=984485 RepID=A0A1E4RN58_9ASCO|nr:hypothetical protein HYPBUDRAFT_238557 [Hyphopichia burtonii NRRL Y-1933]ODV68714.1 hypothetical protein HYPBUDRAFT_238557 [Hyphopichia burtonii NRRL Y-1933]